MRPIVLADDAVAAWSVSASARRVVVSPCSSVIPPAETNDVSMFSPARNSAAQRPPIILSVWSTSPGVTTTWIDWEWSSSAIAGEFVTSVSARGGWRSRKRASARLVVDESTKTVEPSSTNSAAAAAIASFSGRPCRSRFAQSVGTRSRVAPPGGRAPPWTRSISPSAASRSRSRCTVIGETPWSRARSLMEAPPSRWIRSRIFARRRSAGTARTLMPSRSAQRRARGTAPRRAPRTPDR